MYEYNDGHSSSGTSFGDDLDFRMNRFKVPEWMDRFIEPSGHNFANLDGEWPINENSMTEFGQAYGYINASALSGKEVYLTQHFLEGQSRETPFLVDQDINFDMGGRKIYFTFCPRTDCPELTQYSAKEIACLIVKLVKTHGWYEDLYDAVKAMKYWLAQPGTETVESHWWLSLNRNLALPRLGLRRAAMSLFIEGDGVHVSQDAINVFNTIRSLDDTPIMESAFLNTVWYWGEFLNRSVGKDLTETVKKLHFHEDDTLYEYTRADAIVSAMLGCAVPKTRATNVSTWITGGLEHQIRNRVKFGRINIESKEDYGYEQHGNDLIANGVSAPGGMGLVVGLAGSLIAGTPYGSMFGINQSVTKGTLFKSVEAYNYNDLWAYGVVNRWQGYDTYYRHPNSDHDHRIYAANDVGIAMPPVTPKTLRSYESYQLRRVVERERSFGTSLENARSAKMVFVWKRNAVCALTEPVFTAMPTLPSTITYQEVKRMTSNLVDVKYAAAHIMAQYDYVMADFIVAETTTAALVPAPRDQLELDIDVDPPPDIPMPDVGDAPPV
nr:putative capsid protein [Poaceae Liege totivirus 10]